MKKKLFESERKMIKSEKDATIKRYEPFIEKFKKLKEINLKEEINKNNYIKDENARINNAQLTMIYKSQLLISVATIGLNIILILISIFKGENSNLLSIVPQTLSTWLVTFMSIIIICNNMLSIKHECKNKKVEAFQAVSYGLLISTIVLQGRLLVNFEVDRIGLFSQNIIENISLILMLATQFLKKKKLENINYKQEFKIH